ncbi:MAG TPA: TaqI-like C-terminal specificity domain-containing protein [Verrucomicrobiae bacterium]
MKGLDKGGKVSRDENYYIVENTVGKLIEGKTPAQIAEMRFADIACGSGSFLLGVFDLLLHYHRDWFNANPDKAKKAGCVQRDDGAWHLSLQQRREILLHNIYGVDIDRQAVEVAQLSLYLKLLEEETTGTAREYQMEFHETLLPSLAKNIVCGNSLIGTDILSGGLFEPVEERKLNPMNFEDRFPQIFRRRRGDESQTSGGELHDAAPGELDYTMPGVPLHGSFSYKKSKKDKTIPPPTLPESEFEGGFDAIVGNPPYVRQETLGEQKEYFESHYNASHGVADLYVYFIERGISLLKTGGIYSVIVANKWMRVNYGRPLRSWLKRFCIEEIVDFGSLKVFEGATTYPCILKIKKDSPIKNTRAVVLSDLDFKDLEAKVKKEEFFVNNQSLRDSGWPLTAGTSQALVDKLGSTGIPLNKYVGGKLFYGIKTGMNEAFVIDLQTKQKLIKENASSAEVIKPFLVGKDIKRYQTPSTNRFVIFTRRGINIAKYPAIEAYLRQFKERLMPKPPSWRGRDWKGRKPGPYKWYEIQDTVDYYEEFEKPKIIWPGISSEVVAFAFDGSGLYGNDNNQIIISEDKYLLGLLNSQVMRFILKQICDKVQGGFYRLKMIYIDQLPVRVIDLTKPTDKARHDKLVSLVEQMLAAKPQLACAQSDKDKDFYENKCVGLDRLIDALVYNLYGLTDDEIKIVEGAAK